MGGGAQCEPHIGSYGGRLRGIFSVTTWHGRPAGELDDPVDTNPAAYPMENCDLVDSNTQPDVLPSEQFIGLSFWIPAGFSIPNAMGRVNIGEWHFTDTRQPPVQLFLYDKFVMLNLQSGSYSTTTRQYQYNFGIRRGGPPMLYAVPWGRLVQGTWNEVVLDVRWASDSTGYVKSYYRAAGRAWQAGSSAVGIPTVNWDPGKPPKATFYDNFPSNYGPAMTQDFRLYYSDALIGTSLTAVESAMP